MSIREELLSGVFWIALAKYSGLIIQILITAILARLLSPEMFGIIAIALVFITFFSLLSDFGIGPAIIQQQNLSKGDINQIYSHTIWIGLVVAIVFFVSSFPISVFYESNDLRYILQLLTLNVLFATWNIVPNAVILKEKNFKIVALRTLFLQIICGIISIIAAYSGWGVYSLVISPILTSLGLYFINLHYVELKFVLTNDFSAFKKIFKFSFFQLSFNISNYFFRNLDKILIGKYLNMNDLGYYDKSYHLMLMPLNYTTSIFVQVLHPIFTSLQSDFHSLAVKYNKVIENLAFIGFPIGVFFFFSSNEIIILMYGSQWEPAIPVFHVLSISIPLQVILTTIGSIYQAAGDTKNLFYTGLVSSIVTILGFIIALLVFHSVIAVAWSWNISVLISFIVNYYVLYRITLNESITEMMDHCKYPLLGALISSSILLFCSKYIVSESIILNISIKFTIIGLVYISILFVSKKLNILIIKNSCMRIHSFFFK